MFIEYMYSLIAMFRNKDLYIKQNFNVYTIYLLDQSIAFFTIDKLYIKKYQSDLELLECNFVPKIKKGKRNWEDEYNTYWGMKKQEAKFCLVDHGFSEDRIIELIIQTVKRQNQENCKKDLRQKRVNMLPNIDQKLARILCELGVRVYDDLSVFGSKMVFFILKVHHKDISPSTLYKLEAALQNTNVKNLDIYVVNHLTQWLKIITEKMEELL
ncbi:TfoX C-terminal domain-containing protein [Thorsellia anophelis DSM 18579]|uniref:TfoX C-terminal domain-containing protein n=2 Tax=Thorsellia anophelis TaxID=336804 RepID=A0A1I0DNM6_9GAMM|nr:TfoX C-terminal domain-containing protein [Thorsellia anophelis DSM 18579]